jgi:ubiquinone/menaquinone biosynthesis C-methylase UbiE
MTADTMREYYARRAEEYERIYARPERQADLALIKRAIEEAFAGRHVLDIACGTGYFSRCAAHRALSVSGIDANEETLAIARAKQIPNAVFDIGDAYALRRPERRYGGCLITFWWSHLPRQRLAEFLAGVQNTLAPGAQVLVIDNLYVPGNSTPVSRADHEGNTYQERRLGNEERYEVMKNFPTPSELEAWGTRFGTEVAVTSLTYFWMLQFQSR